MAAGKPGFLDNVPPADDGRHVRSAVYPGGRVDNQAAGVDYAPHIQSAVGVRVRQRGSRMGQLFSFRSLTVRGLRSALPEKTAGEDCRRRAAIPLFSAELGILSST